MDTGRRRILRFTPAGDLLATDGPTLVVYDSDSNKRYSTEIGEFLDVAAVGEELWVMASTHLTRLRLADGRQIAMENVERMDPNGRFLISATAPLLPVWHGDEPKVIRVPVGSQ